jgi:hypothetical protein
MTYKEAYTDFFKKIQHVTKSLFPYQRKVETQMRRLERRGIDPESEFTGSITLKSLSKNGQLLYVDTTPKTVTNYVLADNMDSYLQTQSFQAAGGSSVRGSVTGAESQHSAGLNYVLMAAIAYMVWRLFL